MAEKAALFVRLPSHVMASVDELVRTTGRTKQALVTEFVEASLAASSMPASDPEVFDLAEVADLLRVGPDQVLARIGDGGLPGRRFGDDWRFSRDAVMRWLDGADRVGRTPGFSR